VWFAVLIALAGTLAGVLSLGRRALQLTPQEVAISGLIMREGRWFLPNQATPFSGVIFEHYETGQLKFRSQVRQGLLDGLSAGWHTNGQKQVSEHFRAGVSHGLRTKWHPNGRKLSEVMVVDGKLEGCFRRWHEDGTLSEEIEMKHGTPDGLARGYYPSGFLKAEARLRDGAVVERKFWNDGEKPSPQRTSLESAAVHNPAAAP
jgi:antitoxin component YwqK of YwqJK toxin-antitoxin module